MLSELELNSLATTADAATSLPEPAADGRAALAIRRAITTLTLFVLLWSAIFVGMFVSSGLHAPFFSVVTAGIYIWGMYTLVPELGALRHGLTSALVREAVVVVERRQEGRQRDRYVIVVENRGGARRKLVMLNDTGDATVGEVGVAFSRGDLLWAFHRTGAKPA